MTTKDNEHDRNFNDSRLMHENFTSGIYTQDQLGKKY